MLSTKTASVSMVLITVVSVSCSNASNYEKYSDCLLNTMKMLDTSMRFSAMENCELKHPYEKIIPLWKNEIDFQFTAVPSEDKVLFKVKANRTEYIITRIDVVGNHLKCANIPEVPEKPKTLTRWDFEEQAKIELGFNRNETEFGKEVASLFDELDYFDKAQFKSRDLDSVDDSLPKNRADNYLAKLKESIQQLENNQKDAAIRRERREREAELASARSKKFTERYVLINKKSEELAALSNRKNRLSYEFDMKNYEKANSFWSRPIQVKMNKSSGEASQFSLAPYSSTLDDGGPRCVRYLNVYGTRRR